MFDTKARRRVRFALFLGFLVLGVIVALTSIVALSGWFFALSLYYLHLNIEHS